MTYDIEKWQSFFAAAAEEARTLHTRSPQAELLHSENAYFRLTNESLRVCLINAVKARDGARALPFSRAKLEHWVASGRRPGLKMRYIAFIDQSSAARLVCLKIFRSPNSQTESSVSQCV